MDKKIQVSWLFGFYGNLLTEKQRQVMNMYFNEDASLSEIAADMGVSRQAVHDNVTRGEGLLFEYEAKLGLLKQFQYMSAGLKDVNTRMRACTDTEEKNKLCDEIDELILQWEE